MATDLRHLTPADVLAMLARGEIDPDRPFELVDGEIVWLMPTNGHHGVVCIRFALGIGPFADSVGAILVSEGAGFMVGEDGRQLRCPVLSLVVRERRHMIRREGWITAAPDLAVEVLSEGQEGEAYGRQKVPEYLDAGELVVWLANPTIRSIIEYVAGRPEPMRYGPDDEITLDAVAPGFRARVGSRFPDT